MVTQPLSKAYIFLFFSNVLTYSLVYSYHGYSLLWASNNIQIRVKHHFIKIGSLEVFG